MELEFRALPVAGIELSGGPGYNDTEVKRFGAFPSAGFDTASFARNRIPQVHEYNMNLSVQCTRPISGAVKV